MFNYFSHVHNYLRTHGLRHARLPCPSLSCSLLQLMSIELAIQSSNPLSLPSPLALILSQHQTFFPMSQLFTSRGQSIGASPSALVLPVNIQYWFPLGLTGLISLLSKELSRVFSSTTIQKHQFFSTQPSLWSYSHICKWLLEKP